MIVLETFTEELASTLTPTCPISNPCELSNKAALPALGSPIRKKQDGLGSYLLACSHRMATSAPPLGVQPCPRELRLVPNVTSGLISPPSPQCCDGATFFFHLVEIGTKCQVVWCIKNPNGGPGPREAGVQRRGPGSAAHASHSLVRCLIHPRGPQSFQSVQWGQSQACRPGLLGGN